MSEEYYDWNIDEQDEYEVYQYNKYKKEPYYKKEDKEKEDIINEISRWNLILKEIQKKFKLKPRYKTFDYEKYNLYNFNVKELKSILKNIQNQILDIILQKGYNPEKYYKYKPRKYKLPKPYAEYFIKRLIPSKLGQKLFPSFLTEKTIDEIDLEYLHFLSVNLPFISKLHLLKTEYLIEQGQIQETNIVKMIQKDMLVKGIKDKEVEDQLFRDSLTDTRSLEQKQKLIKFYDQYRQLLDIRQKDYENQLKLQTEMGLKRRERLEELKTCKQPKIKQELKLSSPELMVKALSSETRRKIIKKAQEELDKKNKE